MYFALTFIEGNNLLHLCMCTYSWLLVLCIYTLPADHGECVVVLADTMLLELPLEALTVLQGSGISSISRDFSLQVFHSRLQIDEGKTAVGC